jgi:hypothetical protein
MKDIFSGILRLCKECKVANEKYTEIMLSSGHL